MKYIIVLLSMLVVGCSNEPQQAERVELHNNNTASVYVGNNVIFVEYEKDEHGVSAIDSGDVQLTREFHQRIAGMINDQLENVD